MATYKALRGLTIRTVDGDASPLVAGDIWYNSSSKKIKGAKLAPGAWASGGNINSARQGCSGSAPPSGTSAAIIFAGTPPETTYGNLSETYDGSSWTAAPTMVNKKSSRGSVGISSTAVLAVGCRDGTISPPVAALNEEWDGSSWSEEADINTARFDIGGFGTVTAGIAAGGGTSPSASATTDKVESWDGSSWTETTEINTGRGEDHKASAGTSNTAGLIYGGPTNNVESWNGSAWTEVTDMNTARAGCIGTGTQTAALAIGGGGPEGETEQWNGSTWTEVADLGTARANNGAGGTTTNAIVMGGSTQPGSTRRAETEEWTYGHTLKKITLG